MAGDRKKATAFLLKYLEKILPGSPNKSLWDDRLGKMTDKEFEAFIGRLESGEETIVLFAPNMAEYKLSTERNLDLAEELKHPFFQRIEFVDEQTGVKYLSPIKYLVCDLPIRRFVQVLKEKIALPESNKHVDELTDQPTGPSKGSKVSYPELQQLYAQGMDKALIELIKVRGGDARAFNQMNRTLFEKGSFTLSEVTEGSGGVKANLTLSTLLTSALLKNNLTGT